MNIIEIIDKKRRALTHTPAEIEALVTMLMSGEAHDYQISAWLMAACIHGLSLEEATWLTDAFVKSGRVLDLSGVGGVVVDKHSTGGVGDKTTLGLVPLLAACGVKVAKLSGRGLGFSGGTIDKLEAIPGFRTALTTDEFIHQLQSIGMAISSQTDDLAPADGKVYAIRDVTATVESIPLIAASVVSKKIAAGADVIVLDIKFGRGAFMKNLDEARDLAHTCREIGKRLGKNISTVITSMNQPLGLAVGNSLEVLETIDFLQNKGPKDLEAVILQLGSVALLGAGICNSLVEAQDLQRARLADGSAFQKFCEMVEAQGAELHFLEDTSLLPQPDRVRMIPSPETGYVTAIDPLAVAQCAKIVGAGRLSKGDEVNLGVGVLLHRQVGDAVKKGEVLVELYSDAQDHPDAMTLLQSAFSFSQTQPEALPLIEEVVLGA